MTFRTRKRWQMGCTIAVLIVLAMGMFSCFRGTYLQYTSAAGVSTSASLTRGALYVVRTDNNDAAIPPPPGTQVDFEPVFGSPRVMTVPTGMLRRTSGAISGFNLCVPLWIPLLKVGALAGWMWWRALCEPRDRCASCGYDLAGLRGTTCPECGKDARVSGERG
jgi:hypothetical protein